MTIEEILARKECQTFDCKSIQIDPKALAIPIVAMANADMLEVARLGIGRLQTKLIGKIHTY